MRQAVRSGPAPTWTPGSSPDAPKAQRQAEAAVAAYRQAEPENWAFSDQAGAHTDLGFALLPHTWGAGLGTETVHLMCDLGFNHLDLHRIWAARAPLNSASAKTLLRAGMTEEGRIREHVLVRGAWRDSITYSVLDHEWRESDGFAAVDG
ncbi:GNAT family N-acetyltransferase [Streptomyces tubercidicus]